MFLIYGHLQQLCCQFVVDNIEEISVAGHKTHIIKHGLLICFQELILLLGNIEPEYSLGYRFGLAQLSLAQFGPV